MRKHLLLLILLVLAAMPWGFAADKPAEPAPPAPPPPPAAPPPPGSPQQVNVAVKVVEYQTGKETETGLSAYFRERVKTGLYGRILNGDGIQAADITFPTTNTSAITVFLDNISLSEGDIEVILQGLVSEERASILSRPKAMVMVGEAMPGTTIKTVEQIPYQSLVAVASTTIQSTEFKETGVSLSVKVPRIMDDDGDWNTTEDTFMELQIEAEVRDLGRDRFVLGGTDVSVPSFLTRKIVTKVWVRHNQVLILGGLYRNKDDKSLATLPWLTQAENFSVGMAERFIPGNFIGTPLSSTIGNRDATRDRTELVFFIKCEAWRPSYRMADELSFTPEPEGPQAPGTAKEIVTNVLEGLTVIPEGIDKSVKEGIPELKSDVGGEQ